MKPIIALDGDGVLLDYHQAYRSAWQKAFGILPKLKDPLAYWPIDRWNVQRLVGENLNCFRQCFDYQFWLTVPAISGAVESCLQLQEAGYELVCVSAIDEKYQGARLQNLRDHGFPIERVIATANLVTHVSPKAEVLRMLQPVAFIDDYLPYLRNIPSEIHCALILREPNGSPNFGDELVSAHSQHIDLIHFTNWWLEKR
jgi:phosphoglycolate phosphatase-like HAD superfamily hydrolase